MPKTRKPRRFSTKDCHYSYFYGKFTPDSLGLKKPDFNTMLKELRADSGIDDLIKECIEAPIPVVHKIDIIDLTASVQTDETDYDVE